MNALKAIAKELWGLFVDDGLLVVLALVWIVAADLVLRNIWPQGAPRMLAAVVFAIGFLVILAESALRAARKGRAKRAAANDPS